MALDWMAPTRYGLVIAYLIILLVHYFPTVSATCYRSDTHAAMDTIYSPCNPNAPYSMCLRSAVDSFGSAPDRGCLPNGLIVTAYAGAGQFWRQGCTDPLWQSEYCLMAFNGCSMDSNGNAQVTPCDGSANSSTWCCGGSNSTCCGGTAQGAISIAQTVGPSASSSASSSTLSSSTSTVATSPAVSSSSSPTSASPASSSPTSAGNSGGLSVGAEIGIIVGVTVAGLLILGVSLTWLVLKRRQKMRKKDMDMEVLDPDIWKKYLEPKNVSELGGQPVAEIDELPVRHELQS